MKTKDEFVAMKIGRDTKEKLRKLAELNECSMVALVREWVNIFWQLQTDSEIKV